MTTTQTEPARGRPGDPAVTTVARWIGPDRRPLLSWLTQPVGALSPAGVLILAPIGYEAASAHRTLRTLAERLAGDGCSVLRIDYDGTGDSAGDQWDPSRLERWSDTVDVGVAEVRRLGVASVTVIGLQLGATLGLRWAVGVDGGAGRRPGGPRGPAADRLVLWDPVVDGRKLARGTRLLGQPVPPGGGDQPGGGDRPGAVVRAGTAFRADTLDALAGLRPDSIRHPPGGEVLVVDRAGRPVAAALVDRLRELGTTVEHITVPDTADAVDRPAEYAEVPVVALHTIASWVTAATAAATDGPHIPLRAGSRPRTTLIHDGRTLEEEVVTLGPDRLVGVMTTPSGPSRATVVWLNAGSESHVGPGRAWVEYARSLAAVGWTSLRVDFSGWGESPDLGHAPGRPYDAHGVDETLAVVDALHARGHRQVVVAGVCAGAWIGLRAALSGTLAGVVAINPQMYWQPGDPVEADIAAETHVRRQDEIDGNAWGASVGLWSALEGLGLTHPAGDWLDDLVAVGTPTLVAFSEGDDGLEFLEDRLPRAWGQARRAPTLTVAEIPGLDHAMHRLWRRPALMGEVGAWLDRTLNDRRSGPAQHPTGP